MASSKTDAVDWGVAQRVGEFVAGSPQYDGSHTVSTQPRAHEFAQLVSKYSRLKLTSELPVLELVDRPAWIKANLKSMHSLSGVLGEQLEKHGSAPAYMKTASRFLLGAQMGALTGILSQRVLGQYELALLDEETTPRLLLLGPNLASAAANLAVDEDELVLWVSIHEITHAVQFSGAPWLREHLAGMLRQLIGGLESATKSDSGLFPKLSNIADLRELKEQAQRGELLKVTLGEELWEVFNQVQATMSLIEGHAEHTMDVIGAEFLPALPQLRAAMGKRRESSGLPWRVLERLLGLKMKMQQYEVGRRFCDAVVAESGPKALGRAWTDPSTLPSTAELAAPELWVERTRPRGLRGYFGG